VRVLRMRLSPLRGPINDSERSRFVLVSDLDGLSPYSRFIVMAVHGEVKKSCAECACVRHRFVDRSTTTHIHAPFSARVVTILSRYHRASPSWPTMVM